MRKPRGYWEELENRRRFFLELAKEKGFDPLNAADWSTVSNADIVERKVYSQYPV